MCLMYDVPLIPQSTGNSCWAASIAMILAWKQRRSVPDSVVTTVPGGAGYVTSMARGLDPSDRFILAANGFSVEEPTCYSKERIREMLHQYGPLWVASAVPTPHIRVVRGFSGVMLYINDPWPVGSGSRYRRNFLGFFGAMEHLGAEEASESAPIYVAHLA